MGGRRWRRPRGEETLRPPRGRRRDAGVREKLDICVLGKRDLGKRLLNPLIPKLLLLTAVQIKTLPSLTELVFTGQTWRKRFHCLGDSEVQNPNSLLPQPQESRAPGLLFPRTPEGGRTWCSERGSVRSTVVKSLEMRPADTMPQHSTIAEAQESQGLATFAQR